MEHFSNCFLFGESKPQVWQGADTRVPRPGWAVGPGRCGGHRQQNCLKSRGELATRWGVQRDVPWCPRRARWLCSAPDLAAGTLSSSLKVSPGAGRATPGPSLRCRMERPRQQGWRPGSTPGDQCTAWEWVSHGERARVGAFLTLCDGNLEGPRDPSTRRWGECSCRAVEAGHRSLQGRPWWVRAEP